MTPLERLRETFAPDKKYITELFEDIQKLLAAYEFAKDILDHYPWHEDTDTHVKWVKIRKELEGRE